MNFSDFLARKNAPDALPNPTPGNPPPSNPTPGDVPDEISPPFPNEQWVAEIPPALRTLDDPKFWVEFGTRLWRARRQFEKTREEIDSTSLERFERRFNEVFETLEAHGVEILDHAGQLYDPGLTVRVLQFEPTPGLSRETITETVKPSLRVGALFIPGEVIVATPQNSPGNQPTNESKNQPTDEPQHN